MLKRPRNGWKWNKNKKKLVDFYDYLTKWDFEKGAPDLTVQNLMDH